MESELQKGEMVTKLSSGAVLDHPTSEAIESLVVLQGSSVEQL